MPRFLVGLWVSLAVVACLAFVSESADAEEALASWYGPGFSGLPTASGELYDPSGFTAAHKTMPLGTELLVSYGSSAVAVTVNDRGPYVGGRELDLSQGAAEVLGLTETGVDYVEYAWTGQYDVAPQSAQAEQYVYVSQDATTDQYASGSQYPTTTSQEPYYGGSVSVSQSASGTGTIEQYASVEPHPAVADVEPVSAASPVSEIGAPAADVTGGTLLVVRPGETLSDLAAGTGVSVDYLAAHNGIADPDFICPGQVLYY